MANGFAYSEHGADHPYDYAYDYAVFINGRTVKCDSVEKNEFRILIYGEAVNPSITVGGHKYAINGTIAEGETLLIDSITKTITLTTATGSKINWFAKRDTDNYIFEPIPPGNHAVLWSGAFGFDFTVIEKRSEPRWT